MKQSLTVSAGFVNRLYESLIDWGVTEEQIFAVTNLKKDHLLNSNDRIPVEYYFQLGRMAPNLTNILEIGLILGQHAAFQYLELFFNLAFNCKTFRESLIHTIRYSPLGNDVCKAGFKEGKEFAEWSMQYINSKYLCIPHNCYFGIPSSLHPLKT